MLRRRTIKIKSEGRIEASIILKGDTRNGKTIKTIRVVTGESKERERREMRRSMISKTNNLGEEDKEGTKTMLLKNSTRRRIMVSEKSNEQEMVNNSRTTSKVEIEEGKGGTKVIVTIDVMIDATIERTNTKVGDIEEAREEGIEARDRTKAINKEVRRRRRQSNKIGMKKASKDGNFKVGIEGTSMKEMREEAAAVEDVGKEKSSMMIMATDDKVVVTRRSNTTIEGMMADSDRNATAPLKSSCRRARISLS